MGFQGGMKPVYDYEYLLHNYKSVYIQDEKHKGREVDGSLLVVLQRVVKANCTGRCERGNGVNEERGSPSKDLPAFSRSLRRDGNAVLQLFFVFAIGAQTCRMKTIICVLRNYIPACIMYPRCVYTLGDNESGCLISCIS